MKMIITALISCGIGCVGGYAAATIRNDRKKRNRKHRRNRIINTLWNMVSRRCRWDVDHPPKTKGSCIYKGGMDKMTEAQFQLARRMTSACEALESFAKTAFPTP